MPALPAEGSGSPWYACGMAVRGYVIALCGITFSLTLYTLAGAAADFYASRAIRQLNQWHQSGQDQVTLAAWQSVSSDLHWAIRLQSGDPHYYDYLGHASEWGARLSGLNRNKKAAYWNDAINYYRQSLSLRPHSAYAWANIFYAKAQLLEFDQDQAFALERALVHGRHEPYVQRRIMQAALSQWPRLSTNVRDRMFDYMQQLMEIAPERVIALLQVAGRKQTLCEQFVRSVKVDRHCFARE